MAARARGDGAVPGCWCRTWRQRWQARRPLPGVPGRGMRADQDLPCDLAQAVEDEFGAADGRGDLAAPELHCGHQPMVRWHAATVHLAPALAAQGAS